MAGLSLSCSSPLWSARRLGVFCQGGEFNRAYFAGNPAAYHICRDLIASWVGAIVPGVYAVDFQQMPTCVFDDKFNIHEFQCGSRRGRVAFDVYVFKTLAIA